MKQIVTIIAMVFAVTFTAQAQKKQKRGDYEKLSTAQQTDLHLKKMTLALDLTESQQNQMKSVITEQIEAKKAFVAKRKELKASGKKLSADERYAIKSKGLDKKIAHKKKMQNILNAEQFEKFEKMSLRKKRKAKKGMKKRKMKKKMKERKEKHDKK